jgi:hypothetical protein
MERLQQHAQDMRAPPARRWTVRLSDRGTVFLILRDINGAALTWAELSSEEAWQMAGNLNDTADAA